MTHEEPNTSKNKPMLDFMVEFGDEQIETDQRERERVTEKFKTLVDDTLLNNADKVSHHNIIGPEDNVLLRKTDETDPAVEWSLSVEKKTDEKPPSDEWESAEEIRADIAIQKIVDGYGRDYISYRMGSDGVIRRHDVGDMYAKRKAEREAGIEDQFDFDRKIDMASSEQEKMELLQRSLESLRVSIDEGIENGRLARKMGLNDQPIGMQEMEGLEAFVRQAGWQSSI